MEASENNEKQTTLNELFLLPAAPVLYALSMVGIYASVVIIAAFGVGPIMCYLLGVVNF